MAKFNGTVSSGVVTTSEANQVFKFYDPYDESYQVTLRFVYIENLGTSPIEISLDSEWNFDTNKGTKHYLFEGDSIGFDNLETSQVVVHDSGANIRITGQF